jgi:hypothetical protein
VTSNHLVLSKESQEEMERHRLKLKYLFQLYERSPKVKMPHDPELAVAVVDSNEPVVDNTRELGIYTPDGEKVDKVWARCGPIYAIVVRRGNIIAFDDRGKIVHVFTSWQAFMQPYWEGHITFVSGEDTFVPVPEQLQEVPL